MALFDAASINKYALSHSNEIGLDAHVLYEDIDTCVDELCKCGNDVPLDSFRPQKELNPFIWVNGLINSRVRLRLLEIADDFVDSLETDWAKPKDIILTGSLANYNWSKYSDFDVHVLMDFKEVDKRTDFVADYFNTKKNEWNNKHENLKIYGFPVEMYIQDVNEEHTASGVYSLEKNTWLVEPVRSHIKAIQLDKYYIKEKVMKYAKAICSLEHAVETEDDEYKCGVLSNKVKKLFDRIKYIRKEALKGGNEMHPDNVVYKALRRHGFIKKLLDLKAEVYDKIHSIER